MPGILDLMTHVQNGFDKGRERGKQTYLGKLAGQAYGAAPDQQRGIVQQAITTNPDAGFSLAGALGKTQDRDFSQLGQAAAIFSTIPDEQKQEFYATKLAPLAKQAGYPVPETYDPRFQQAIDKIAQIGSSAGTSGNVQSTYVDEQGNRVAIMRDGSTQVLGRNDPGMQAQTITVTGPDGRPRQMTFNKRTGSYEEAQFGGAQAQPAPQPQGWQQTGPTMFTAADGQPIPPEDQQALLAAVRQAEATGGEVNVPASRAVPAQGGALPPRLDYQNGGSVNPFVGQSPAEKVASEAAARRQVELSTLPAELQMRTDAAIAQTTGQEAAKTQAEREATEPQRQEKVRQALAKTANITRTIDDAMSRVGPTTAGFIGSITDSVPGTASNDLRVTVNTIKANLAFDALQAMREASPTGGALGAVSERELALLESAVASLDQSQSPEQMRNSLARVKQHYTKWAQSVKQSDQQARARAGGQAPAAAGGIDDLLGKYGIR